MLAFTGVVTVSTFNATDNMWLGILAGLLTGPLVGPSTAIWSQCRE